MSADGRSLKDRAFSAREVARLRFAGRARPPIAPTGGSAARVLIGPANSAGQGFAWARALEGARPGTLVTSMKFVDVEDRFAHRVDQAVLSGYGAHSRAWQHAQLDALSEYRAVFVESADPLLGGMFGHDSLRQIETVRSAGPAMGLIFHGSDLRDPDTHLAAEPASYFALHPDFSEAMRVRTRRSRQIIAETGLPVWVSTPDLLSDVPGAEWLPIVVAPEDWATDTIPFAHGGVPRVVHAPSNSALKGTDLIDGPLQRLHDAGRIEYRRVEGVSHARMQQVVREADVVLDQFRTGSYGVAACEALAAGRVVISHISEPTRSAIRERSGLDLPILESDGLDIEGVLEALLADRERSGQRAAEAGPAFVRRLHDGRESGRALAAWLESTSGRAGTDTEEHLS